MPVRPPSRCPQCRRLVPVPGPCGLCRRVSIGTARKAIYNSERWHELRDQVLSEEPLCRVCRAAVPTEVDHIVKVLKAPHLAFVRSNLQAICRPCHTRKTVAERDR